MKKLSNDQVLKVIELYADGKSSPFIGNLFNVSKVAVCGLLKRRGIARRGRSELKRRYAVNGKFFDDITSESQAYWLGFFLADGCVVRNGVHLGLMMSDIAHVKKFRRALGSEHPIKIVQRCARIGIYSESLVAGLKNLGIMERKSFTATPPLVQQELERHMWRGIIDGDGCIHLPARGIKRSPYVRLVGSQSTCLYFQDWLARCCNIHAKVSPHKSIYEITASGFRKAEIIVRTLYDGATVVLDRKQAIVNDLLHRAAEPKEIKIRLCTVNGCLRKHRAKGLCRRHFYSKYEVTARHDRYLASK